MTYNLQDDIKSITESLNDNLTIYQEYLTEDMVLEALNASNAVKEDKGARGEARGMPFLWH